MGYYTVEVVDCNPGHNGCVSWIPVDANSSEEAKAKVAAQFSGNVHITQAQ